MSDPIAELKAMIIESIASNKAMHESTAVRMAADARASTEQIASMKADLGAKVQAVVNGLAVVEQRVVAVETKATSAETTARAAMQSHDSLQIDLRAEICEVKSMLAEQNNDIERREQLKKEEREKESLAAKRVGERREFRIKMATVWAPIFGVVFTGLAGTYVAYVNARAHEDTTARLDKLKESLTSQNIVSPSTSAQNFSPAPVSAASPRVPPAPAKAP